MPLTPGSTFERYEIRSLIGRGGMGEVYHAIDTRLNRPVALKVLRTDEQASTTVSDAGGVARLLREARAAAALNHPNSVAIYELGEAEGIAYIAMELVIGAPLRAYVNDASVSLDTKLSWLVDAARALGAAHKAGLVHRDVKPGNIMVSEEGVVKVLDFGLAKPVTVSSPHDFQTMQGQVLGTPRYMAPEQLEGAAPSALADQYAFGLTAYEVLSGVYSGGPLSGTHTPLDQIVPGVSPELARDVSRMMKRRPAERFPTMEAAAQALRACAPSGAREAAPSAPAVQEGARRRGSSDAPTAARTEEEARRVLVALQEPESVSGEIPVDVELMSAKGGTLLLAPPMRMASGAPASISRGATLPLAGPPVGVQLRPPSSGRQPVSSGSFQPTVSGVYSAKPPTTGKDDRAALPRKAGGPGWVAVALVGLLAALAGIIAAWMSR